MQQHKRPHHSTRGMADPARCQSSLPAPLAAALPACLKKTSSPKFRGRCTYRFDSVSRRQRGFHDHSSQPRSWSRTQPDRLQRRSRALEDTRATHDGFSNQPRQRRRSSTQCKNSLKSPKLRQGQPCADPTNFNNTKATKAGKKAKAGTKTRKKTPASQS